MLTLLLGLNLELITAIAKGHDLGHTPFGHAGDRTLQLILERELVTRFNLKLGKKADGGLQRRDIFHHALIIRRVV
jgi:dGTPase